MSAILHNPTTTNRHGVVDEEAPQRTRSQITALEIMKGVFAASLLSLVVPLSATAVWLANRLVVTPSRVTTEPPLPTYPFEMNQMLALGVGIMVLVPVFKSLTHLPLCMSILFLDCSSQ